MTTADDDADIASLRRCQQGDITGLDELVARRQGEAIRIAYLLTQDRAAAEDIAQESFLRMYQASRQFRDGARFAPWFFRIVLNMARQQARTTRQRRESSLEALQQTQPTLFPADDAEDPATHAEQTERQVATLDILRTLTTKQREVIVLRFYGGYSDGEAARILGIPGGTARWRLYTALRAFERVARRRYPWLIEEKRTTATLVSDADNIEGIAGMERIEGGNV